MQVNLFDQKLQEVVVVETGIRYILRCNPVRQEEIRQCRQAKIDTIHEILAAENKRLVTQKRAKVSTVSNSITNKIKKYRLENIIELKEASA